MNAKGRQTDPATGKEMQVRETFQIIVDNTHKMEMFMTHGGGKEFKWSSHLQEKNKSFFLKNVFYEAPNLWHVYSSNIAACLQQ